MDASSPKDEPKKKKHPEMSPAAETETIEDIMSFIEGEAPAKKEGDAEKEKKSTSSSKTSVEEIFGKDVGDGAKKKKSVYDLEPDEDDFGGVFSSSFALCLTHVLFFISCLTAQIPTSPPPPLLW